jgi:hypothetical protein
LYEKREEHVVSRKVGRLVCKVGGKTEGSDSSFVLCQYIRVSKLVEEIRKLEVFEDLIDFH